MLPTPPEQHVDVDAVRKCDLRDRHVWHGRCRNQLLLEFERMVRPTAALCTNQVRRQNSSRNKFSGDYFGGWLSICIDGHADLLTVLGLCPAAMCGATSRSSLAGLWHACRRGPKQSACLRCMRRAFCHGGVAGGVECSRSAPAGNAWGRIRRVITTGRCKKNTAHSRE